MTVTWNPSDKAAGSTLSNGNLTETTTTAIQGGARTTRAFSGKGFFELTLTAGGNCRIGVSNTSAVISNTNAFTDTADGLGVLSSGNVVKGGSVLANIGAFVVGDVIGVAVDADARTVGFNKNGGAFTTYSGANVPTGSLYPTTGNANSAGTNSRTANFGDTAFAFTPPAGYTGVGVTKDVDVSMAELTLNSGTNDFVQSLPELALSSDGFTEPGFVAAMAPLTLAALAETLPYAALVLPAMSIAATISDTASFAEDLPALAITAQVQSGEIVTVVEALPALTLLSGTGASSELEMAPLELEATAVSGNLATFNVDLPALSIGAVAYQTDLWTAALTVPAIICAADFAAGNTATVDASTAALASEGMILSGSVATLLEALPLLETEGTAYGASVNTMSGTLPALTALADVVAAVSTALGNAWVMNLRNSALTQYTNFGFNSMTLFNGKYLGASDAGIVELGMLGTSAGDAGTQIDASARTGALDSDSSFMKRAPYLYVQSEADGDMVVSKISAEHGRRDFLLPWSGREGMQQRRVKTGRKSKSEFWQWEFSNRLGSYMRVASFDAMAQRTGRRVQ